MLHVSKLNPTDGDNLSRAISSVDQAARYVSHTTTLCLSGSQLMMMFRPFHVDKTLKRPNLIGFSHSCVYDLMNLTTNLRSTTKLLEIYQFLEVQLLQRCKYSHFNSTDANLAPNPIFIYNLKTLLGSWSKSLMADLLLFSRICYTAMRLIQLANIRLTVPVTQVV